MNVGDAVLFEVLEVSDVLLCLSEGDLQIRSEPLYVCEVGLWSA